MVQIGRKVRKTIEDIGGTMPENLPTPNKSIKQIEKDSTKIITGGLNELLRRNKR
jgi:DNA-damage-inducible protein D